MKVSVVIPVGPRPSHQRWLAETIASVNAQEVPASEILLIDDMARLDPAKFPGCRIWKSPWRLGMAHAFCFGWALAQNDFVIPVGSDDILQPWGIRDCLRTWEKIKDPEALYYFDHEYSTGERQNLPVSGMFTKGLLYLTGGFPPESAVGACDHIFISMVLAHKGAAGRLHHVESERPPLWYRQHGETETKVTSGRYYPAVEIVRDEYNRGWTPPAWAKP